MPACCPSSSCSGSCASRIVAILSRSGKPSWGKGSIPSARRRSSFSRRTLSVEPPEGSAFGGASPLITTCSASLPARRTRDAHLVAPRSRRDADRNPLVATVVGVGLRLAQQRPHRRAVMSVVLQGQPPAAGGFLDQAANDVEPVLARIADH